MYLFDVLKRTDWKLYIALALLLGAGLISLASTDDASFTRQIVWISIGLVVSLFLVYVDLRSFFNFPALVKGFYAFVLGLLAFTLIFAPVIKGNRAWIMIGSFQFQPSELAKLALILALASYFSKRHVGIARWRTIITSFLYFVFPAALIALQPDLGSALMLFCVWFGFILISGIPFRNFMFALAFFGIAFGVMWGFVLEDYQKDRVLALFDPQKDPLGVSYNVIQSKIAIGSGGFFGKGFGQGTQAQLGFLPEAQTDFIFAAIAEEGGILAILLVLFGFGFLMFRILKISYLVEGNIPKFICLGTAILFITQFLFNVGSNMGFLPVVGVTFPFVSYGGSSMLINLALIGIVQSLYAKK